MTNIYIFEVYYPTIEPGRELERVREGLQQGQFGFQETKPVSVGDFRRGEQMVFTRPPMFGTEECKAGLYYDKDFRYGDLPAFAIQIQSFDMDTLEAVRGAFVDFVADKTTQMSEMQFDKFVRSVFLFREGDPKWDVWEGKRQLLFQTVAMLSHDDGDRASFLTRERYVTEIIEEDI